MARSPHEPRAKVMRAADVWQDAERLRDVLRTNAQDGGPQVQLQIPLSTLLAALDNLSRDQLLLVWQRVEERLAG